MRMTGGGFCVVGAGGSGAATGRPGEEKMLSKPATLLPIAVLTWRSVIGPQIIANTTTKRPDEVLGLVHADQQGGLSGRPLFSLSTHVLSEMYKLTKVRKGGEEEGLWSTVDGGC